MLINTTNLPLVTACSGTLVQEALGYHRTSVHATATGRLVTIIVAGLRFWGPRSRQPQGGGRSITILGPGPPSHVSSGCYSDPIQPHTHCSTLCSQVVSAAAPATARAAGGTHGIPKVGADPAGPWHEPVLPSALLASVQVQAMLGITLGSSINMQGLTAGGKILLQPERLPGTDQLLQAAFPRALRTQLSPSAERFIISTQGFQGVY